MSDSEIVEITDTSINVNCMDTSKEENNKRKLSKDEQDEIEESISKKLCRNSEEGFDDSSLIVEPTITESLDVDDSQNDELEQNITESKLNDEATNNLENDVSTLLEEQKVDETTLNDEKSNYESSSEEDDDEALIMRAMNAAVPKQQQTGVAPKIEDEPIALDTDSEEDAESIEEYKEPQEDFEDLEDEESIEEDDPFMHLHKRMMRYSPKFYFARKLIKRSIKVLSQRTNVKDARQSTDNGETNEKPIENANQTVAKELPKTTEETEESESKNILVTESKSLEKEVLQENVNNESIEKMDIEESPKIASSEQKIESAAETINEKERVESNKHDEENANDDSSKLDDSNGGNEVESLMHEISICTVDEIMTRYIFSDSDQQNASLTIDEFSEQLFYCLQENKKQIEEVQRVWNEKVHLKFKMREIMERIRRNKIMSEIETFGIKASQDGQSCNLLLSSKSSTTTNSEHDHYIRSSSKSVNQLIHDVRENVLKKDKLKNDDASGMKLKYDETFDECSSYGLSSNMFQTSASQGRQGQTIDVQSIINDFRQKNPQEIPRRGRRMKSSFPNNLLANQFQAQQLSNKGDESIKSNSSSVGFPEVSLLPVNSFYKSHSPQFGQKSSLLQSILTKQQPNKNTLAMQSNSKSSTLARLLTAPEKSFQSPPRSILQQNSKVHNNGEITITPIAGTSRRQLLDDEENSEPPLVIDESDDFISERHTATGSDLLCQGCRRNKALFMCAGCSRQWYCSKECQELAWDDHAESCMV